MQLFFFLINAHFYEISTVALFSTRYSNFFWHFSAMTRATEILATTDHQKHIIYVISGLKTQPAMMIIVISGPLPAKLPIKNLSKNFL